MRRAALLLSLLAAAAAPALRAQADPAVLLAEARDQIDRFNHDSAAKFLDRALAPGSGATTAQRVRAYVLYGIVLLHGGRRFDAQQAFRYAQQLNPSERVDSLDFLDENLVRDFAAVRAPVTPTAPTPPAASPALRVDVSLPFDTTLRAPAGKLVIGTRTSSHAQVTVSVAPADAPAAAVWTNIAPDSVGGAAWDLRGRDGNLVPSGRYLLRVTATDLLEHQAPPVERFLHVANPNSPLEESAAMRVRLEERLFFAVGPGRATAGRGFGVVVRARDLRGGLEQRFEDTVWIGITPGTGHIGAGLSGATRVAAVDGVATFTGLSLDSAGTDYSLTAAAAAMASVPSVSFDVVPGPATRLSLATDAARPLVAGTAFRAVATARDDAGNVATDFRDSVTVAITAGTGRPGATLLGATRSAARAGVADFPALRVDSGGGYALTATAAGLAPATSRPVNLLSVSWRGWASLAAGGAGVCGVSRDGFAYCWGGARGNPDSAARRLGPQLLAGGAVLDSLQAGADHACGLTGWGAAFCWGSDSAGALGDGAAADRAEPVAVAAEVTLVGLAAGGRHTCGLTAEGAAYCWGENLHGELGDGSRTNRGTPIAVAGGLVLASLAAGDEHSCGLTRAGTAYCWGRNVVGQLGDSSTTDRTAPVPVAGRRAFRSLAAGGGHTCALTAEGAAWCWGDNSSGQAGDGSTTDHTVPVAVDMRVAFAKLALGDQHTCGLTPAGAAWCWGANDVGQLGIGSNRRHPRPAAVTGGQNFTSLTAADHHTCGVTVGGAAFCWGWNDRGQLGDGTVTSRSAPVAVAAP